ncbi:MAG: hypothetical protein F4219_07300 [Gammaproteobacteria bacterium]|nr:hypothetical protein [Gammaproteobacteria bacterium]
MQPTIPIDRGVLTEEQHLSPWRSPDMEGANPADFLSVCQSANITQTTTSADERYRVREDSFR